MSMSMGMSLSQSMEIRQELTTAQRQEIAASQIMTMRLELVQALHGYTYRPEAKCDNCGRELTLLEIMRGFLPDPADFTTRCTGCGHRFQPKLVWSNQNARMELPFFCDIQTQAQLHPLKDKSPDEIRREHAAIYHSAIAHHGTLKGAFAAIGVEYTFTEVVDVKRKVEPFLGSLPDTIIAEVSGLKVSVIRRMRRSAHIEACRQHTLIEDAEDREEEESE